MSDKDCKILGLLLPTNSPDVFYKYFYPSLHNIEILKPFIKILINFQYPWDESKINQVVKDMRSEGFDVEYSINKYEVPGPGLVPVNRIREDTASINPYCKYYMIFDDDMSFLGHSPSISRNAGEQIIMALCYLESNDRCGVHVFGGTLIKKIQKDHVSPIRYNRDYVTGKGIIFRNISPSKGLLLPKDSLDLLGSDEEKLAASYRISQGYWVSESPFTRINHYENQLSSRNKSGKIPGYMKYKWNVGQIRDQNNFSYIRSHYNPEYEHNKGNICSDDLYKSNGGVEISQEFIEKYTEDFSEYSENDLILKLFERINLK